MGHAFGVFLQALHLLHGEDEVESVIKHIKQLAAESVAKGTPPNQ